VKEFEPFRWFDLPVLCGGLVLLYEAAAPNTATEVAADGERIPATLRRGPVEKVNALRNQAC
jgi:hypothetical protein